MSLAYIRATRHHTFFDKRLPSFTTITNNGCCLKTINGFICPVVIPVARMAVNPLPTFVLLVQLWESSFVVFTCSFKSQIFRLNIAWHT